MPEPEAAFEDWVRHLLSDPEMRRMGHNQDAARNDPGLGWLYYALARVNRPRRAVVIGSWRGFVPAILARALQDNRDGGEVTFIDPSLADGFWRDPDAVRRHFAALGLDNVRHYLATTQQFVESDTYRELDGIGLLFVDGYHSAEQARYDYETFADRLTSTAFVLFHDSLVRRYSPMYGSGNEYTTNVPGYIDTLRADPGLQLLDLPFGTGLTILRRATG